VHAFLNLVFCSMMHTYKLYTFVAKIVQFIWEEKKEAKHEEVLESVFGNTASIRVLYTYRLIVYFWRIVLA
jgi:hypothetical protein